MSSTTAVAAPPSVTSTLDQPLNPIYSQYRNKNEQLVSFLGDHNVRLSSSRTVNLLPNVDQERLLKKAIIAPRNERKLHKLAYGNPLQPATGLVASTMNSSVAAQGISAPTEDSKLMSINVNSHFTVAGGQQQQQEQQENDAAPSECLFIRHHNCVYFVDANEKMTGNKSDNQKSADRSVTGAIPMFYTNSISSCTTGLAKHSRRYQVYFD